jgi:hypothetical protein
MGALVDKAASRDSLVNPASLDFFVDLAQRLEPTPFPVASGSAGD